MRFAVFSIATAPDIESARRVHQLPSLDDVSVAKVLFHRRKQESGGETLRWDQRAVAGITVVHHSIDSLQIQTLSSATASEPEMLQAYYAAELRNGRMVSWNGGQSDQALMRFRTLLHEVTFPAYWQALSESGDPHLDLCDWFAATGHERPGLDETARRLGYPGLAGLSEEALTEDWLNGDRSAVGAFTELAALNTYLLALRVFVVTGEISRHDSARVALRLREELRRQPGEHLARFMAAWGDR